jgi:predicted tellurium resistance membrane protein TerC
MAVPFLQAVGGLLLFWIAWKLVHDNHEESKAQVGTSRWDAIRIIIVADAVMSLDNVIALVGVARGDLLLLAIGITITIPLVIFGSALLTFLLDRLPVLVYAGAGLLVYIAVEMLFEDVALEGYLEPYASLEWIVATVAVAIFLAVAWIWAKRTGEAEQIKGDLRKTQKELDK